MNHLPFAGTIARADKYRQSERVLQNRSSHPQFIVCVNNNNTIFAKQYLFYTLEEQLELASINKLIHS